MSQRIIQLLAIIISSCLFFGCSSHSRSPIKARLDPDAAIEKALLRAAPDYTEELVKISGIPARYVYRKIDLNQDGQHEVVVYLLGSFFCGTGGCNLLILKENGDEYKIVNNFPITQLPLLAATDIYSNWTDLYALESGGGAKAQFVKYSYERGMYRRKGTVPDKGTINGGIVIPDTVTYEHGVPLLPLK